MLVVPGGSEVNRSIGGSWYEVMNLTVGANNVSQFQRMYEYVSNGSSPPLIGMSSVPGNITEMQAAVFVNTNMSNLISGFLHFRNSSSILSFNTTVFGNLSRLGKANVSYGGVNDSYFYVFGWNRTSTGYVEALYAIYGQFFMFEFYNSTQFRSSGSFLQIASYQVSIFRSYNLSALTPPGALTDSDLMSDTGQSWASDFNVSFSIALQGPGLKDIRNALQNSSYNATYQDYRNFSLIHGFGVSGYTTSTSLLLLGYVALNNTSLADRAYSSIQASANSTGNATNLTSGQAQYFYVMQQGGHNSTVVVGHVGQYLFIMLYGGTRLSSQQIAALVASESSAWPDKPGGGGAGYPGASPGIL